MAKKKQKRYYNDLEKDGFVLLPHTSGILLDGIFHNEDRQELAVAWYAGTLIFKPIESELSITSPSETRSRTRTTKPNQNER